MRRCWDLSGNQNKSFYVIKTQHGSQWAPTHHTHSHHRRIQLSRPSRHKSTQRGSTENTEETFTSTRLDRDPDYLLVSLWRNVLDRRKTGNTKTCQHKSINDEGTNVQSLLKTDLYYEHDVNALWNHSAVTKSRSHLFYFFKYSSFLKTFWMEYLFRVLTITAPKQKKGWKMIQEVKRTEKYLTNQEIWKMCLREDGLYRSQINLYNCKIYYKFSFCPHLLLWFVLLWVIYISHLYLFSLYLWRIHFVMSCKCKRR